MLPENFTPKIHRIFECESTNAVARELAATQGANEGAIVIAERQSAGRGRGKRQWHSPAGGLYFSVLLYPSDAKRLTDLAIVAGVALAQTVKDSLPKSKDVSLKWPNDCLIGWKKVGGVLCESLGEEFFHLCVVGIGINVNLQETELIPFKSNPFSATSFELEVGGKMEVDKVAQTLIQKLFNVYRVYQKQGFSDVQFLWERNCGMVGKKVEIREAGWRERALDTDPLQESAVGTFLGIDDVGALVLSNSRGERRSFHSGEITCFWP